ncbi:unnamed protein product [Nyctereutes procyonoides]|uniref:(raccoon dog) hypothetical protein n=1 Tax=Nyctereutes procyonoides TaxID=34880 RepID=A0A811ZBA1_NYCPR|nr:unnamed protein product [Nyctereutes procyonoides]
MLLRLGDKVPTGRGSSANRPPPGVWGAAAAAEEETPDDTALTLSLTSPRSRNRRSQVRWEPRRARSPRRSRASRRQGGGWPRGRARPREGGGRRLPAPPGPREGPRPAAGFPGPPSLRWESSPRVLTAHGLDGCYDGDDDDDDDDDGRGAGGGGGGEGKEDSSKGAPERAGEETAEEGKREKEAEKAFSHLREGDPFWRERAEDGEAAEAGRGCRSAGLLVGRQARPEPPPGPVSPRAEAARGPGTARGSRRGGRPSRHLQPLPSRPPPPAAGKSTLNDR